MPNKHRDWIEAVEDFRLTRRNLPHMQDTGGYYFTTSVTKERRELDSTERQIVLDSILFLNGKKYDLDAAVVMPDHFHLIIRPLLKTASGSYSLSEIFHSLKSFTANKIGGGGVWQAENYDHLIRNERDYFEKLQYILNNPLEASLCDDPFDYEWLYWIGRVRGL